MDDKIRINLRIDNELYPLTIKRIEEEKYRAAAKQVDTIIQKYRNNFSKETEKVHWVLAALELALINSSLKDRNDTQPYFEKLAQLLADIDECINDNEATK